MFESRRLRCICAAAAIVLLAGGCTNGKSASSETSSKPAASTTSGAATVIEPSKPSLGPGPGPSNTGVPAGTKLNKRRTLIVREDHAIVDAQEIVGAILVQADDVTITRTRVISEQAWGIRLLGDHKRLVVRDVEVVGTSACEGGLTFGNYTATRVNLHGCEDGFRIGDDTTIEDSWVHDLKADATSHNDGIQATNGKHIIIRRNNIDHRKAQTSAILLKADFGTIDDVLVEDNRLNGGSYVVYVRDTKKWLVTNVTVRRNRFGRDFLYNVLSHDIRSRATLTWDANIWDDSGEPITLPRADTL